MINKASHLLLIFILLNEQLFRLKILGFRNGMLACEEQNFIIKKLAKKDLKRTLKALNLFYKLNFLYSCLVCSVSLKRILSENNSSKILIGVRKSKNIFLSHAWVTLSDEIIFGEIADLDKYKVILTK